MTQTTTEDKQERPGKKRRTSPVVFYRQVVAELRKVIWPTRKQLITYTIVTLVFALVMVAIIFGLDWAFGELVLKVFG